MKFKMSLQWSKLSILWAFLICLVGFSSPSLAAIDVNNSFAPANLAPSQISTLSIRLLNSSTNPATAAAFTNILPTSIVVASTPDATNTCGGTFSSTSTQLTLTGGTIPGSDGSNPGSCLLTIKVKPIKKGTYVHQFNTNQVSATYPTGAVSNTQISQGTLVAVLDDVIVRLTTASGFLQAFGEENVFLNYTFTNTNPVPLTNFTFYNDIAGTSSTALKLINDGSQNSTCGGTLSITATTQTFPTRSSLTGATIPANSTCTYRVKANTSTDSKVPYTWLINSVGINAGIATSTEGASNSNSIQDSAHAHSGLRVIPSFSAARVNLALNPTAQLMVQFRNANINPITNFSFTDVMPTLAPAVGAMKVISIDSNTCGGTTTINSGGVSYTMTGSTIPGIDTGVRNLESGTCLLTATVTYDKAGTYTHTIPVGNLNTYNYVMDSAQLNVSDQMLQITTSFDRDYYYQGEEALLKFEIINTTSTVNLTNIDIANNLNTMCSSGYCPNSGIRVSGKPIISTCSGVFNAPANGSLINLNDIALGAGKTCSVTVPVKIAANSVPVNLFRYNDTPIGNITYDTPSSTNNIYSIAPRATITVFAGMVNRVISLNPLTIGTSSNVASTKTGPLGLTRVQFSISRYSSIYSDTTNSTQNINFSYALPAGHTIAPNPNVFNGCGGTVDTTAGTSILKLTGGSLPSTAPQNNVSCLVEMNIRVPDLVAPTLTQSASFYAYGDTPGYPTNFSAKDATQSAPYNQFENYTTSSILITRQATSVSLNKEFLPVSINGGGKARMRISLSNVDSSAISLTKVGLTDTFAGTDLRLHADVNPTFTDITGVPNASGCRGGAFSGNGGDTAITLSDASIDAASTCYFEFNVTAYKGGNHVSSIPVGALKSFENISNNASVAATLTVGRHLNVALGFSPNTVATTENATLNINLVNSSLVALSGAALVNTLPAGLDIVGTPTTTCGGTVSTGTSGTSKTISLVGGTIASESLCKITASVRSTPTGSYTNTIPASVVTTSTGATNIDAASAILRVISLPQITKTFSVAATPTGRKFTMYLAITNPNSVNLLPEGLSGINFSDTLSHMTLAGPVSSSCLDIVYDEAVSGGSMFRVSNIRIKPSYSCGITVSLVSNELGSWPNTINDLKSHQTQLPAAPTSTTIHVVNPPTATQSFTPSVVRQGTNSRLTFTLTNPAPVAINLGNPAITNLFPTIPGPLKLAFNPNITKSCNAINVFDDKNVTLATAGSVGLTIKGGSIPAASSCTIAMDVEANAIGSYTNSPDVFTTAVGTSAISSATLTVNPNSPPVITSNGGGATATINVPEGQTSVTTVTATDADNDVVTYSISGGADSSLFDINTTTGVLTLKAARDFEAPTDVGANNGYDVQVRASDGYGGSDTQNITVMITDVPELMTVRVKGFLEGAYRSDIGLMHDTLRTLNLVPTAHPYSVAPFSYNGTETLSAAALAATGNDAVVDWVLVELRSSPTTVLLRKAAILHRNGRVVDAVTGSPDLQFLGYLPGSYYVVLRHRNHLGVMTAAPVSLANTATLIDFTLPNTLISVPNGRLVSDNVAVMWSGDANSNDTVIANGPNTDANKIFGSVLVAPANISTSSNYRLPGYHSTDLDMNGLSLFTGPENDINILIGNILLHPSNAVSAGNFVIQGIPQPTQLPQ